MHSQMPQFVSAFDKAVFYAILDTGYVAENMLKTKCAQLIESGARVIQLRAKKQTHAKRREMALSLLPLFRFPNAPVFVINDDIELAAALDGKNIGLHIGQDDIPPHRARKIIGYDKALGLSTHSIIEAKSANAMPEVLDYFAVGPVFATQTKPGRKAVGLELVSRVAALKPRIPWFAIGGVNMKTLESVALAGARRIVAVSDVLIQPDSAKAVADMTEKFLKFRSGSKA